MLMSDLRPGMAITLIIEADRIRLLEGAEPLPAGEPIRLSTAAEVQAGSAKRDNLLQFQMPAFLRDDELESTEELF
jgi:hypothetical protein